MAHRAHAVCHDQGPPTAGHDWRSPQHLDRPICGIEALEYGDDSVTVLIDYDVGPTLVEYVLFDTRWQIYANDLVEGLKEAAMTTQNSGASWAFDGFGHLYDLGQPMEVETYGPPPPLRWVAPVDLPQIFGMPCAVAGRLLVVYKQRCASEVFESNGGLYVNVVDEDQWYRWLEVPEERRPERIPRASCTPTRHVWIEVADPAGPPPPHPLAGDPR